MPPFISDHYLWLFDSCPPPGPGPGLPDPDNAKDHQQSADPRHAEPPYVDQASQPVPGKIRGSGGGLEGRDRRN